MNIRWSKIANDSTGIVKAASDGFSCVELPVDYVMKITDEQFIAQKDLFLQHKIIPEVFGPVLPADVIITEQGFNLYVWTEYLKKAVQRVSELGCRKMAMSNGRARVLPLEGDTSEMKAQFQQFIHMLCGLSEKHGIEILIEPLSPRRTNYLNSFEEIEKLIHLIPEDNLSSLISLRELPEIGLMPDQVADYPHLIRHVYLENPVHAYGKRVSPRPDDEYDYRLFLSALGMINYDGVICLPEDADSETLRYCQSLI